MELAISIFPRHGVFASPQIRDGGSLVSAADLLVPRTDFARALLAAALGHLNEIDEARRVWGELMEINPQYAFREHFGRRPFRREDVERVAEGLAKSGLPS